MIMAPAEQRRRRDRASGSDAAGCQCRVINDSISVSASDSAAAGLAGGHGPPAAFETVGHVTGAALLLLLST